MDPATITQLIMLGSLLIERVFAYVSKIRRSKCVNGTFEVELADSPSAKT
jgi:hypothetical protein